ncbi:MULTISPECIES: hypothetical protein [unclassified Streptomyces]|uniref:hypothetical protein n=1 Tax=unclassified Streptomyces TaxID=2593676 RepID=UPI0034023C18
MSSSQRPDSSGAGGAEPPESSEARSAWLLAAIFCSLAVALATGMVMSWGGDEPTGAAKAGGGAFVASMTMWLTVLKERGRL